MSTLSDVYHGEQDIDFPRTWRPLGLVSRHRCRALSIVSLARAGPQPLDRLRGRIGWESRRRP